MLFYRKNWELYFPTEPFFSPKLLIQCCSKQLGTVQMTFLYHFFTILHFQSTPKHMVSFQYQCIKLKTLLCSDESRILRIMICCTLIFGLVFSVYQERLITALEMRWQIWQKTKKVFLQWQVGNLLSITYTCSEMLIILHFLLRYFPHYYKTLNVP